MPIYEFYCGDCHTIFSFLARSPDTSRRPDCPRCGRAQLERRASAFAISKGRPETAGDDLPAGFDEERMERVMAEMANEVDRLAESDPRQMARVMRRLLDGAGMPLGPGMEEAMRRLEAGEDPDRIEQEMGDVLEGEDEALVEAGAGAGRRIKALRRRLLPPTVDRTLYEL
jgi:putative FmdB family regulatory protein